MKSRPDKNCKPPIADLFLTQPDRNAALKGLAEGEVPHSSAPEWIDVQMTRDRHQTRILFQ